MQQKKSNNFDLKFAEQSCIKQFWLKKLIFDKMLRHIA